MDGRATGWRALARTAAAFVLLVALSCQPAPEIDRSLAERIIAVAPNVVEILYVLGLDDRVVGVGSHCSFPPQVAAKPKIGGLLDPRLEEIALLDPDLAILLPSERSLAQALETLGIEVLVTPVETLEDIRRAMLEIGLRVGVEPAARLAVERFERAIGSQAERSGLGVLLVVGRQAGEMSEIYAAAGGTYLDELLARAGGSNVLAASALRYPSVGLEEILTREPDAIVELQPSKLAASVRERLVADWRTAMPASPPCVTIVEGDYVLVPGPRAGRLLQELSEGLERCGDGLG